MTRTSFRLPFTIFGIPVQLDLSFLLVLPLLAWIIGSQLQRFVEAFSVDIDPHTLPGGWTAYGVGLLAALGLFASILIHELGHSLVGRIFHLRIRSITLWVLGGMAQFERIPRHHGVEAVMAIAGPITSLVVGGTAALVLLWVPAEWPATRFLLTYLSYMNVILAAFNLLPALPLDGGRVLRSLLALRLPYLRATQICATLSRGLALLMGLFGLLVVNVWLILLAFFIYMAVGGEYQYATVTTLLRGIRVADVMTREVHTVPPDMPVEELIQKMFAERFLAYPVVDTGGRPIGFATLQDVRRVRHSGADPAGLTVADIMSREFERVHPDQSALDAFQRILRTPTGRLLVVDDFGQLAGLVSKTDLLRALQVRTLEREWEGESLSRTGRT
ncbi:MAG: site-2 protease family protein [Acidobacteriota bacterium]